MYDIPQFTATQTRKIGTDKYEAFHGTDDDLVVSFENFPVYLEAASKTAGRKLYEDRPHIRILFPGDRTREIFRLVKYEWDNAGPPDPERFPRQWAAFQNEASAVNTGTLLSEWPMVNKAQVLEFKALNVITVEQLAAIPDTTIYTLGMGGRELRDKAQAWLKRSENDATITGLMARLDALEAENRSLRGGSDVAAEAEKRQENLTRHERPAPPHVDRRRKAWRDSQAKKQRKKAGVKAAPVLPSFSNMNVETV